MSLPAPNLDDRRFQELVDEAKRMVQARCPEWTDHNVSDPGVTLIETFAYMMDQLLYRLNRVPDRLYIKFLELIGVRLLPPTPARAPLTFWLSTPAEERITIPVGTRAATLRTDEEPIVFETIEQLEIVPCSLQDLLTQAADVDHLEGRLDKLVIGTSFPAFSAVPVPGDALVFALSEGVPSCAVQISIGCHVEGVGVDPLWPPLIWEARTGDGEWVECDIERDDTGGINRTGDVVLHIPRSHAASVIGGQRAGWLRARVLEPEEDQPAYSAAPIIEASSAATIGGSADAAHAEVIEHEGVGFSDGTASQSFTVLRPPILAGGGPAILEVGDDEDGWQEWEEVDNFASSAPDNRHYMLDAVNGEITFGPLVRLAEGGFRQYGAVPPKGAPIRMRQYTTGGGRRGNVPRGGIRTLKSAIPFVAAVSNRDAAQGGVDGEDIEGAKERGPIVLHTRSRAVTAQDFEQLTRRAAPEIARVRCLPAGEGADAGAVRVLVVPAAAIENGQIRFADLVPSEDTLHRIADLLDEMRLVGTRVSVEPPLYHGVTVVATLRARPKASAARVRDEAILALNEYVNPLMGGVDGGGWPWGRPLQAGEIYSVLQAVPGVDLIEDVRIFSADPITGERGQETQRLELEANSLVFSYEHRIRVEQV
jgi:predicted phage baseplate assembly protein